MFIPLIECIDLLFFGGGAGYWEMAPRHCGVITSLCIVEDHGSVTYSGGKCFSHIEFRNRLMKVLLVSETSRISFFKIKKPISIDHLAFILSF